MIRRHRGEEEGQIIPALLLTVVAILFLGLVFVQVGSAAEQKTQTQTATDSAAVASTHQVRDFAITTGAHLVITEWAFGVVFAAVPQVVPQVQAASCDAVQRNWNANPHKGAQIDCGGSLVAFATGDGVQVNLTAPPGQVVDGPAEADNERAKASARARVVLARCPELITTPIHKALQDWILDRSLLTIGVNSNCFTADDETELVELEELFEDSFGAAAAAIGPPGLILDVVRRSTRVELVDD
jgi:hypothetical protein